MVKQEYKFETEKNGLLVLSYQTFDFIYAYIRFKTFETQWVIREEKQK